MGTTVNAKLDEFFGQYRIRHYSKGQVLLLNGDEITTVYYMIKGKVKQYDVTYRGDEIILNVFKPGAFFPMWLVINKTPNQYIFEAETEVQVRQAPAEAVVTFVKDNPDVLFDLLSRVYRGLDGLLGRMAHLMASSAKARLMYEIVIECRRFGQHLPNGGCTITLNQKDLAARAGLTRETVNREVTHLIREKLLSVMSGTLTVHSLATFEDKLSKVI